MRKNPYITLFFTVAIALFAVFAATGVMAGECDPSQECTVYAQLNKKTTKDYTIKAILSSDGELLVPCGPDTITCPDGFGPGEALAAAYSISSISDPGLSKINQILASFSARCGEWLEAVEVRDFQGTSSGFKAYAPLEEGSPYPLDSTKSALQIDFNATDGFVIFFRNIETIPDNGSISTDIINIALGVGSGTFPCAGLLGPAIVKVELPEFATYSVSRSQIIEVKDSKHKFKVECDPQTGDCIALECFKPVGSGGWDWTTCTQVSIESFLTTRQGDAQATRLSKMGQKGGGFIINEDSENSPNYCSGGWCWY